MFKHCEIFPYFVEFTTDFRGSTIPFYQSNYKTYNQIKKHNLKKAETLKSKLESITPSIKSTSKQGPVVESFAANLNDGLLRYTNEDKFTVI